MVLPSEPTEFRDEVRRIFQELDRSADEALTGECAPALDVFETDEAVEIVVDLPAVSAASVRIVARGQTVLIAGHKTLASDARRVQLPPGRARLRTLRAGDPDLGAVRYERRARHIHQRRTPRLDSEDCRAARPFGAHPHFRRASNGVGRATPSVIRLLFIGDIVGRPGRDLVRRGVAALRDYHQIDLVIANAENAAAGFGITRELGEHILDSGVDVMTSGNHIWDKKEAIDYIGIEPRLLRPANFPDGVPGNGSYVARTESASFGRA